jgi:hypothetical protein
MRLGLRGWILPYKFVERLCVVLLKVPTTIGMTSCLWCRLKLFLDISQTKIIISKLISFNLVNLALNLFRPKNSSQKEPWSMLLKEFYSLVLFTYYKMMTSPLDLDYHHMNKPIMHFSFSSFIHNTWEMYSRYNVLCRYSYSH